MEIEAFLDKLEGVQSRQGYYVARCPGHEDREASLSITDTEDRILLNCHAGCKGDDVLDAMGLTWRDVVKHAVDTHQEPEAVYQYHDERGDVMFEAVRFPNKKFRQRHLEDGEWVYNLDGCRRVIYRLPQILQAIREGRTVYIVEGEKDANSMWEAGFPATTSPMGAGKWRPEYATMLAGAKAVIIVADRDEPGREHARRIKKSLEGVAQGTWIVQAKTGKDATDHLQAGHTVMEFEPLRERVRRGIITANEMADQALEDLTLRPTDLPGYVPWAVLPSLVLRPGRAYAIGAYTGDGKTSMALQAFRTLAAQGIRCGYYSLEMPERDLRNKLVAQRGIPYSMLEEPWRLRSDAAMMTAYHEAIEELRSWNADIIFDSAITSEEIRETSLDREHDVVFVDHLHRFAWGSERRKLDEQVNGLTNLALDQNVVLVVLCQLRKFTRGKDFDAYPQPTLQDFRETSMIGDDASMALSVWRQRDSSGLTFTGHTQVQILKNRHTTGRHDQQGQVYMPHFDQRLGMFVPAPTVEVVAA